MKKIEIIRRRYYAQTTIGELHIDNELFCYTLEDTVRPLNIKVKGYTAIPTGDYSVTTRYSPTFKRDMLLLYNDETKTKVEYENVSFSWVYFHGGNKHQDTEGCVLVAYNENENEIWGTAEKDLYKKVTDWINEGEEVLVTITNTPQDN